MAARDDIGLLVKMRVDFHADDSGRLNAGMEAAMTAQLIDYFQRNLDSSFIAAIAEVDEVAAGTAFLTMYERPSGLPFITGKIGIISNVFTYPEYRRRGIASRLMGMLIEEGKRWDLSYMELNATESGAPLYAKFGFEERKPSGYTQMRLETKSLQ
jgi:GNAT superfamily N-acetyltransferase